MARALMALRRQNFTYALAASFPKLKAVATTFYANLVELQKQSNDACFEFISHGEASSTVVALLQGSPHVAHLQAQLTAVFEAIADGRTAARVYPQPRKSDYDALASDLTQRGWTQADMQLFRRAGACARRSGRDRHQSLGRGARQLVLRLVDPRRAGQDQGRAPSAQAGTIRLRGDWSRCGCEPLIAII